MNALRRFIASRAARRLSKLGHDKAHQRIIETAARIRNELNLPPHPGLRT